MHQIRAHLHHCNSGGRAIFLDATAGRYFCLPNVGEAAFLAFQNGGANDQQIDWLTSHSILVERVDQQWSASCPVQDVPEPRQQLEVATRPTVLDIWSAVIVRISLLVLLKYRGFGWAYRSLIAAKGDFCSASADDIRKGTARILAAFHATDLLMGKTNQCLPRSLAFLRLCNARGHFPSLVVGVRTNPFTAHAWVQVGDTVLNDGVDQVRVFTPIMVL